MVNEKSKIIKIMNELVRFCLNNGIHNINTQLDIEPTYGKICVEGCCNKVSKKAIKEIEEIFNSPYKDESEECYWNLMGSNDYSEMHLLGALITEGKVEYDGEVLKISVIRNKQNYKYLT